MSKRLPAEWERQRCLMLVFPTRHKDWQYCLKEIQASYFSLIEAVCSFQPCHVICDDKEIAKTLLKKHHNLSIYDITTDDTWIRDFGAIECFEKGDITPYDFVFNAWGEKFSANRDNEINKTLKKLGFFQELHSLGFILEGGSIDSNGEGILLSTTKCLFNENRNKTLSQEEIQKRVYEYFGLKELILLEHGELIGDDTDAHIDTLARFIDKNTIAYLSCKKKCDVHYEPLKKMEKELQKLSFNLIPLPMPKPIYYEGKRLPATYTNFIFLNGGLIVPTYNDPNDTYVLKTLQKHLPSKKIVGVDSSVFIREHGSLHCATMNYYAKKCYKYK